MNQEKEQEQMSHDTVRVLESVERILSKFVVFPSQEARDAAVLWVAASWVAGHLDTFGRLYFQSAEYGSGKTLAMEMVAELTRHHISAVNATPAVIYRSIDNSAPTQPLTVCVDEADMLFGRAGSSSSRTELLALLNAGYKRGATVPRARGQNDVHEFRTYAPVILAGVGKLPDALMTRSIVIRMKKANPDQLSGVTAFRERFHRELLNGVQDHLELWSSKYAVSVSAHLPDMPKGISGRTAEVWEGLLIVAEMAGGEWLKRAHDSAKFMKDQINEEPASPTKIVVKATAELFEDSDVLTPAMIAAKLGEHWKARAVSKILREVGMIPTTVRVEGKPTKGFKAEHFTMMRQETGI